MGKWNFGFTMMIVGMGGTLFTLWILSLLMTLLKKLFPMAHENDGASEKSA